MGNEMGNNNTSGVKEEERLAVEDPKGLSREPSSFDYAKGVTGSEDNGFDVKSNGLVIDNPEGVGEIPDENQKLSRDEKEQSGAKPIEDPKALSKETSDFDDVQDVLDSEDNGFDEKSTGLASDNPERVGKIPDKSQELSRDEKEHSRTKPIEDPKALSNEISDIDDAKDALSSEDNGFDEKSNDLASDNPERVGNIPDSCQEPSRDVEKQSNDFVVVASLVEKPNGDPKELSKETSHFDIGKGLIGLHEKTYGLASNNPERVEELSDMNQTRSRDEKEQGDDIPVVDSLTAKPNEEDNGDRDESLVELNMDKTVENPVQKEVSSAKNGVTSSDFDTRSTPSNNLELESSELDQHGIHAEESVPDSKGSPDGTEQVLGLSSTSDSVGNAQFSETKALENPEESVDAESNAIVETKIHESLVEQTKEELSWEKFESEDGEELGNGFSNIEESSNDPSNLDQKYKESESVLESLIREDSSESESVPEAISKMNVEESEEKSVVVSEETGPIGEASENGEELIHGVRITHPCEDSVTELESESRDSNELQNDSITLDHNEGIGPNKHSLSEEENASEDHEANAVNGPDSETIPSKPNTENSSEKTAFIETENQPSQDHSADSIFSSKILIAETLVLEAEEIGPVGEASENGEEIIHGDKPANPCGDSVKQVINPDIEEEAKASEDCEAKAKIDPVSETVPSNLHTEDSPEKMAFMDNSGDSIFSSKSLIAEILVSMNEIAYDRARPEELKRCVEIEKPEEISPDSKAPSRESVERSSTDSDRESVQYAQMRKSPSFSLDLQNQESEKTPLLFHDKAEITQIRHETAPTQSRIEEKETVALERSDSEMAKTPFLGFPKEDEEEANNGGSSSTPRRQSGGRKEAKNGASSSITVIVSSSSSKGEKRRSKSSLFANCMCCTIH